ncbi:MAG: TRAP transporter substrate-binding protein DctP [Deltaproteobacteria bacterium]|jgi:TRAP-type C4-dicarboxylate transport system substrate-binding protein|nr:TRAP transporter substrate-binding protein DctP [Deltaproteobacteria bacterium]
MSKLTIGLLTAILYTLTAGMIFAQESVTLRYSTQHPVEHVAQASAEAIKAEVEAKTQGRVKITIYPANQLGDWTQIFDEVMMGTIDMAHGTAPESHDTRIAAGFLPYLSRDYDELSRVFAPDSFLSTIMSELMEAQGLKFFGFYCEGFSGTGLIKPAKDPAVPGADKGVLVRVPALDGFKFATEYLGYRTSTLPYADVFAAIQTRVVDGWVGGPPNLNYLNYRDLIKYYYQTNLSHETTHLYMNLAKFNSLSPEDQKVIEEAFRKQSLGSIASAKADDEKYSKLMADMGIEVVNFTSEELATLSSAVRENVWPKLAPNFPPGFLDQLMESLK